MLATPRRLGKTAPKSLMAALIARAWSAPGVGGDEGVRAWWATAGRNVAAHRRGVRVGRADDPALRATAYPDIRPQVARDQLFYGDVSKSHVAEITGVRSDAHLCAAFRERFGASPTTVGRRFQG
jgi:hypothetical protein